MQRVVSHTEWLSAMEAFREKEKAATRERDALSAARRQLPVTEITKDYQFEGPAGVASLDDLFDGRRQLLVYHFMFDESPCTGCSMMVDNMGHTAHLHARDTSRVLVSIAPFDKLDAYRQRMGWDHPWYSSAGSSFNRDFGATRDNGEMFAVSALIRSDKQIYLAYQTTLRGVEYLGSSFSFLDITPMGRQEQWEDSPDWVAQTPAYQWWKKHDEY